MRRNIATLTLIASLFTGCEKALLGPGPENSAQGNYDVLWETIDGKYGLFPAFPVDWDSLHEVFRSGLNEYTTSADCWNACCSLLSNLDDAHITLFNENYSAWYCPWQVDTEKWYGFSIDLVKSKYLDDPVVVGEGYITYGKIKSNNLGYIYISSFHAAPNGRDWVVDLDMALRDLANCQGIIVDIRNNGGGFAVNDNYVAASFIDHEITYFYGQMKTGTGHDDFGDPFPKTLTPREDGLNYTRPNVLLTNRFSSSGSEIVAQIFSFVGYSTQIGDTTTGCFGDVLHVAEMPNGWTLNYPCVLYKAPDGSCPEGIGIVPDIYIENSREDIEAGNDLMLEQAIEHLSK